MLCLTQYYVSSHHNTVQYKNEEYSTMECILNHIHILIRLSIHPSIRPPFTHASTYLSTHSLTHPSIHPSIHPSTHPSTYPSTHSSTPPLIFIHLSTHPRSIHPFTLVCIHPSSSHPQQLMTRKSKIISFTP